METASQLGQLLLLLVIVLLRVLEIQLSFVGLGTVFRCTRKGPELEPQRREVGELPRPPRL